MATPIPPCAEPSHAVPALSKGIILVLPPAISVIVVTFLATGLGEGYLPWAM